MRQEISVSLYGEVQKEVIQATLANDFGVDVGFRETTTICIERPAGTGAAVELLGEAPATRSSRRSGLRIEPAPVGTGIEFRLEVELGSMPPRVPHGDRGAPCGETLREGLLRLAGHGLPRARLTHTGYCDAVEHAPRDFRNLTPLVLMRALEQAGTVVCEPIHRFRLEIPGRHARERPARAGAAAGRPEAPALRGLLVHARRRAPRGAGA